jgi:DNA polymerase elongation subunit (family B)
MDWKNIIDMPIHHTTEVEAEQIPDIINYCINDVRSTKQIMQLSKEQINLRKALTEEYNIDLFSASEPRISKELFLHFLSKQTGIKKYELRQMRTHRPQIVVNDIILPYIEFKTATFQNLLKKFREVVIYPVETKGGFKYSVQYKGVKTDYGLGGIHGARTSRVYESTEDMVIMTSDVTSFYPNLAIRNGWAPAHLPKEEFCEQYEWFFEERKKIPKSDPRNYVYKIILNSTYGLSNDENSFLYDPQFTMSITINGQLSLTMLYEMICEGIPGAIPLMQNTDGLETMIPREYVDKYMEICKIWESMTNLQLEHDKYSKIVLGDVNNYIAVNEDGKSKCKGRFEFKDLALHKNKSFLIIPMALHEFFVNGVEPIDTIKANKNIFDFCGGVKIKGDWNFWEHIIKDGDYSVNEIQHTIRYYMSNNGSKIVKKNNTDNREIQIEAGKWMQSIFINYEEKEFSEYDINYDYYIQKVKKEIEGLLPNRNQLSLF